MYSPRRQVNRDGTRNVSCSRCFEFISTVPETVTIQTALCIKCQAHEEGIELSQEHLDIAYPSKIEFLEPDPMASVSPDKIGYLFKALVAEVKSVLTKKPVIASKQIADDKRRSRVMNLPIDK